jgi:hypothetical protein
MTFFSHLSRRDSILILLSIMLMIWSTLWSPDEHWLSRAGLIGSVASFCGVLIAIFQVWDAKVAAHQARDASTAARIASESTSRELRNKYYRNALQTARRLISEIRAYSRSRTWPSVVLRVDDLGDHAGQLAYLRPMVDQDWIDVRTALSAWSILFQSGQNKRRLEYNETEWVELCNFIAEKIDREHDPFE